MVDPFHIVRLANQAVTRCRQRIQHATLGHRGWARDPLYATRKLFLLGSGTRRRTRAGTGSGPRCATATRPANSKTPGSRKRKSAPCISPTTPPSRSTTLDDAIALVYRARSRTRAPSPREDVATVAVEILNHHTTGASNGPVEAANLLIKQVKRSGRGFRNLANYRLRILLAGGLTREHHPVTRLRARPSSVAVGPIGQLICNFSWSGRRDSNPRPSPWQSDRPGALTCTTS